MFWSCCRLLVSISCNPEPGTGIFGSLLAAEGAFGEALISLKRHFYPLPSPEVDMAANPVFPEPDLHFHIEPAQNLNILHCMGRITSSTAPMLKDEVAALISQNKHIVLDLTKVDFIDSSGLGTIVSAYT